MDLSPKKFSKRPFPSAYLSTPITIPFNTSRNEGSLTSEKQSLTRSEVSNMSLGIQMKRKTSNSNHVSKLKIC